MLATDLTADLAYDELARIADENGEPFNTLAQCDLFLRAAGMLRRRIPEEADNAGERIRTRDLNTMMAEARKARSIFLLANQSPTVIVPCDDLR
ncbi:MAG: hypothetical protein JW829_20260 [Pirellulales bacterium]|nr:hypothetical protein [Pirellulales bacterium]